MTEVGDELQRLLEPFKAVEDQYRHTATILIGDKHAHRVISAWSTIPINWYKPCRKKPKSSNEVWDWIWSGVSMDWELFSGRTSLTKMRLQKVFEPLRANRLIYPDGSLASHAEAIMKTEVAKALKQDKKK